MKKTTKKSPTGAPLGNPLKFFREGGEKIKAMFKKGGYNTPTQSLPKKYNGGPGSGMGRMAADDVAYDSMMGTPTPTVVRPTPKMIDPIMAPSGSNSKRLPPILDDPGSLGTPPIPRGPYSNTTSGQIYIPEEKNGGMMKKGGATKATKFAALAPPFNKATAADRIVGAKKNAKKK